MPGLRRLLDTNWAHDEWHKFSGSRHSQVMMEPEALEYYGTKIPGSLLSRAVLDSC